MRVPSPLNWFGSKSKLAPRIVKHFPWHQTYVEPFGGSAAVLFAKEPAEVEVFNDLDGELASFFRVLRDPELCPKLKAVAESTLYARAEFELAKDQSDDPVESARRFLVRQRMSFGGNGQDWCYSIRTSRRGTAAAIRRWQWGVESLPAIHRRLKSVQIECRDWRDVMSRFDAPGTLFFLDPPYHPETRVAGTYRCELTAMDHRELVDALVLVRGMVVLSGYAHETYSALERAGWIRIEYPTCTHNSGSLTRRIECLWLSPSVTRRQSSGFALTPSERMREGAYHAHNVMVTSTTRRLRRAIQRLQAAGLRPTPSRVARAVKMSREHVTRKYRHLLDEQNV